MQETARTKLVSLMDKHLQTRDINRRDKLILDTVGECRKYLKENNDLLILSADKGGKTVAMDRGEYETKLRRIINDICTYRRLKRDPTSCLMTKNNILVEKLFIDKVITQREKYILTNKTATAPRIYGLPKIHKHEIPLRPICSSINSPSYELCKYVVNILKNLAKNSIYNVKDAREFKERVNNVKIGDEEILISFDVVSLFPSIPVNMALKVIEEKWTDVEKFTNIRKDLFLEILSFCIKDSRYFKYDTKIYEQRKGMPMGSPASPIIADIIMEKLLDVTMEKLKIKPRLLTKYVDDIFAVVRKDQVDETLRNLNAFNGQIQFTYEVEKENRLPFLDSIVCRTDNLLKLNWYQKETASGRLISFYSKHPRKVIINTAINFIRRVLDISDKCFHTTNKEKIRKILKLNHFPTGTINNLFKFTRGNYKNDKNNQEPKIFKRTTYIPRFSERLLHSGLYDKDTFKLAQRSRNTVGQLFSKTKTKLKMEDKSNVVYRIECDGQEHNSCNKVYVGTTKTKLKTRLSSHKSDLKALNRPPEQKTALAAHCATTGHKPNFNNVKILSEEENYNRRYFLEMLHIMEVPTEQRLNYKSDVDGCAHIYRHTVEKYRNVKTNV